MARKIDHTRLNAKIRGAEAARAEEYVNNLLSLIANQQTDVNFDDEMTADTLAIDPASYAHLGRQMFTDGVTTPGESALENLMRRAPSIKKTVARGPRRVKAPDASRWEM